jgi:hypothetical protein
MSVYSTPTIIIFAIHPPYLSWRSVSRRRAITETGLEPCTSATLLSDCHVVPPRNNRVEKVGKSGCFSHPPFQYLNTHIQSFYQSILQSLTPYNIVIFHEISKLTMPLSHNNRYLTAINIPVIKSIFTAVKTYQTTL